MVDFFFENSLAARELLIAHDFEWLGVVWGARPIGINGFYCEIMEISINLNFC